MHGILSHSILTHRGTPTTRISPIPRVTSGTAIMYPTRMRLRNSLRPRRPSFYRRQPTTTLQASGGTVLHCCPKESITVRRVAMDSDQPSVSALPTNGPSPGRPGTRPTRRPIMMSISSRSRRDAIRSARTTCLPTGMPSGCGEGRSPLAITTIPPGEFHADIRMEREARMRRCRRICRSVKSL